MADDLKTIVQRMIDAGESEENIATVIHHSTAAAPVVSPIPYTATRLASAKTGGRIADTPSPSGSMLETAVNELPTIGGVAGGAIGSAAGPLGGVAGAGLGGMWGQAIKQSLHGGQPSLGEAVGGVAKQGAIQAGAEVGGLVVGGLLTKAAPRLYQSILKPTVAMREQYPTLVQTALEHGIPISRGGTEKAAGLVTQSRNAADALVSDRQAFLERLGPEASAIDPAEAVGGITTAVSEARQLPVARPQMQSIGNYARQYLNEHPQGIPLTEAQSNVRGTDRAMNRAYRAAIDRGDAVTAGQTSAAMGINNETRKLLRARVPGLETQNANTQAMKGVEKAITRRSGQLANNSTVGMQHAINAGIGSGVGAFGGKDKGFETFALMEALTNPAIASRLAIAAGKAGSSGMSAQAIRQALISLMASHAQEP